MMPKSVRIFSLFLVNDARLRSYFKNSCFVFHWGFQTDSKTIKTRGLRPRAFISFLVFGNPDETLALVLEILHETLALVFEILHEFSECVIKPQKSFVPGCFILHIRLFHPSVLVNYISNKTTNLTNQQT